MYAAAGGDENGLYPWGQEAKEPLPAGYHFTQTLFPVRTPFVPVGSHPDGNGRGGHSDLSGSMSEWVLDLYADDYADLLLGCASDSECVNLTTGSTRGRRGGDWTVGVDTLRAASRVDHFPEHRGSYLEGGGTKGIGIRCARSPSP